MTRKLYVGVDGSTFYVEEAGSGTPIVLVHGFGLDCRMWDDQVDLLAAHHKVIRYDLRGFGKSSLPDGRDYAHHTDLNALLQRLNVQSCHLVGLSLGGRVVTDFSITYPHSVLSLSLVESVLHGFRFTSFSMESFASIAKGFGIPAANKAWLEYELFGPARKNPEVGARLASMVNSYSGWHWLKKNPWKPLDPPSIQQLRRVTAKTLVVVGELSMPDFRSIAEVLTREIPNSRREIVEGAGHMVNMEQPAVFNSILMNFLSENAS